MTTKINSDVVRHCRGRQLGEMGEWLEQRMPNPPLPDPQRWSIITVDDEMGVGQQCIEFADETDAILFSLAFP